MNAFADAPLTRPNSSNHAEAANRSASALSLNNGRPRNECRCRHALSPLPGAGLDRLIEEERAQAGRDPERDAEFWSRKITEVEVERRGYHRLAAKRHMTDEELGLALSELDEIRETAGRELEAAQAKGEALKRLEHDRDGQ
jgi:hypothetical protein